MTDYLKRQPKGNLSILARVLRKRLKIEDNQDYSHQCADILDKVEKERLARN